MKRKLLTIGLIVVMSAFLSACTDGGKRIQDLVNTALPGWHALTSTTAAVFEVASQVESIADKLNSSSFGMFNQASDPQQTDTQSCESDNTATVTIYSTNSKAQSEIDVILDGIPVGSLSTYFANEGPACLTPSAKGVITLKVPAGKHAIEAVSPNLNWPGQTFTVKKCDCILLPLS